MTSDKIAFVNWLLWMRKTSPELFTLFKIKYPEIINALSDSRLGFDFDWGAILDVGKKFVETALPIYAQQKQFKQQLELAKVQMQIQAPAGFTQPAQQVPAVTYPRAVAVPVSTPTTTQLPTVSPTGQPLVIRIDKSQIADVQAGAKSIKNEELLKYLPYALGGTALLIVLLNR